MDEKCVVLSDIHFGAFHDITGDEMTNTVDLINCLDLIENEIKPKTIVLLGDVLDLWRADFDDAWDEAEDICFFTRLVNYAKENEAEIIYIVGNHDHYLKEANFDIENLETFRNWIKENSCGAHRTKAKGNEKLSLVNELGNLKLGGQFNTIRIIYPHYKMNMKGGGLIIFDHGHYSEGVESSLKKLIGRIRKKLFGDYTPKIDSSKRFSEVYTDMEANFSAMYSMLYYSRMDDVVREFRDKIYTMFSFNASLKGIPKLIAGIVIGIIIAFLIGALLYLPTEGFDFGKILSTSVGTDKESVVKIASLLIGIVGNYKVPIGKVVLGYLGNAYKSGERGSNVDDIVKKINEDDLSIEYPRYTYRDFLEEGHGDVQYYIFGHTHVAGVGEAKNLKVYNTGSWIKKKDTKTGHCSSSFIIIDPEQKSEDKVKIYRMVGREKVECSFKDGSCDKACKV